MGAFFGSVHVKSDDRDRVKTIIQDLSAKMGIHFLLGPVLDGWIGVYPEDRGQDSDVSRLLANDLSHDILQFMVYDDDILQYWYYRSGQLVDHYYSKPGYFDEKGEELAAQKALKGKPEVFRDLIGDDCLKLKKVLSRSTRQFAFESERLEKIAGILKIPNMSVSYEDLKAGHRHQIKGWRKFEEIPAQVVEVKTKKRVSDRGASQAAWKKLAKNGLLLFLDQRFGERSKACSVNDGFFVAWTKDREIGAELEQQYRPWQRPMKVPIEVSKTISFVGGNPNGRRVMIGGYQFVRIWEIEGDSWSFRTDIDEPNLATFGLISMSGRVALHFSTSGPTDNICINDLFSGQLIDYWPNLNHHCGAIHPNDEWAVVGGRMLQLISIRSDPIWTEFDIGVEVPLDSVNAQKFLSLGLAQTTHSLRKILLEEIRAIRSGFQRSGNDLPQSKLATIQLSKEKKLKANLSRLKATFKGEIPLRWISKENVISLGFSRDGKWLWCGTDIALRVYDWTTIPREPGIPLPEPTCRFECFDGIHSISEEMNDSAIVFGSSKGTIYRMDYGTGEVRVLLQLPGRTSINGLMFSKTGDELGVSGHEYATSVHRFGTKGAQYTWCIFSYEQLKRGMEELD